MTMRNTDFTKPSHRDFATSVPVPSPRAYPNSGYTDVICHNCMTPGHYSSSCPEPQVSFKQKAANRAKIEEASMDFKPIKMPQQAPAAQAATIQPYQELLSPKGQGPLTESSGNAERTAAPLPMTPAILRRGQSIDEWPFGTTLAVATKSKVQFNYKRKINQLSIRV